VEAPAPGLRGSGLSRHRVRPARARAYHGGEKRKPAGTREWNDLEHLSLPGGGPMPKVLTRTRIMFSALEAITVPTLLITGDADLYTPPPVLELFARRIKSSTSLVFATCGHSAYWEQPARFNQAILDFLRRS
jgi:pimeloyl-ACP methyl ester carboxylesterase